jgi:nidogen (entactin)
VGGLYYYLKNQPKGIPQRINGKVSGKINGLSFQDEDLHSYVVTSDGRAYTAVSKMNETIGFDLQPLSMLGGVVGWLFARSTSINAPNGYQLTGMYIHCGDDSLGNCTGFLFLLF